MQDRHFYRPELDALRFFAFLGVFCYHAPIGNHHFRSLAGTGAFGMCLFFVLSAYLLVTILLLERKASGTIDLKAFAARRILRIWPPYFLVLFCTYVAGRIWPSVYVPGHALLAFSLLVGNIYFLKHGWVLPTIMVLWSISVEEQFYVAVPVLTKFASRRLLYCISIATIALAYATLIWLGKYGTTTEAGVWANSFVQFQFFASGALIALILERRELAASRGLRAVLWMLGPICWFASIRLVHLFAPSPTPARLVIGYLLALLGTVSVFFSVMYVNVHVPAAVVYLGKISYGLYLFHQIWISLFYDSFGPWYRINYFQQHKTQGSLLALCGTIVTAALSYHFFERKILRYRERFEIVHTRPA